MKTVTMALAAATLLTAACGSNGANNGAANGSGQQITGAGSTFVYPVLSAWAADYRAQSGTSVNYQSIGSGGGIAQVEAGTVDFGATDQPLQSDELAKNGLAQFPVVVGGIVPVVNIPGLEAGKLKLTGPVLADIYQGKIKTWNDPAIVKINPGLNLPGAAIATVHRSDGSGTTFNFTHYLAQVSPAWKSGPGEGKTVSWTGGVGGKGNEGVAAYVKQLPNSLGYVEYAYVMQNKMTYALLQNSAGNFVAPSAAAFGAAAGTADWAHAQDFNLVMTNAPGANAYPLAASTFILVHKQPKDKAKSDAAIAFFKYALEKGQGQANKLDYVPLPDALVKQIESYIGSNIK
ncbi:phosphate ABC transporter substrate-binding protein PstS [Sphingomonas sp.]|uniref:phosphate ABC transporter substrate-binding protein PstS n=1 Tax=Sphingomonas sp. TaxID=28214 RepID=UPI0025E4EF7F|nr:phosphate ABC transporter substrate-binding protein PstS [Sphingomonas sp.]MBV9527501.1 phosphate ABC transporter substrate-binding protein PstS [Sphingomonas sp.]